MASLDVDIELYRREFECLLPIHKGDVMSVMKSFKRKVYEIIKPETSFFGGLISIKNPVFEGLSFIGRYSSQDDEFIVYIRKASWEFYFMRDDKARKNK